MPQLNEKDRKIIKILQNNASETNAAVGKMVGISGPAVHERLKRLKASGVIVGSRLIVDPEQISPSFLSFVLLKTTGPGKSKQVEQLEKIVEIEEIHSIAGQFSILVKVRTRTPADMENVFERMYEIDGIEGSESIIAFKSFLERPMHLPE